MLEDYTISTKQNQQRRQLQSSFEISEIPSNVSITDISFIPTSRGDYENFVFVIFKCKNRCKTIFTVEHIKEMERFAEEITRDPLWPKLCRREGDGNLTVPVDAWGCTQHSYFNLTRFNKIA